MVIDGLPGGRNPAEEKSGIRGLYERNRILIWVCVLIGFNQLGFGSIVPVVPLYAESFGVSQTAIGLTIAIYGLARFLLNVPTGVIADRFGRREALALGGVVTVLGNVICGLAPSYMIFLSGRFVAGAGAAMVITGTQVMIADISRPENRGRMMSVYMGTFMFAVGLGPLPGGFLAQYVSLAAPFYVYAVLGALVTALAWFRVPETRDLRADGAPQVGGKPLPFATQLRVLTAQIGFLLISIVSFATFFARTGGLFTLIPTLAQNKIGLTAGQIGVGLAMISIMGLLLAYPSGVLVDRIGRKMVIVPSTLISGVALLAFAMATSFFTFILACSVWAFASGIAAAAPTAYAADMAPPGMNAQAMGTYRMLADFGYVAGPLSLGFAADLFSTEAALYGTAILVVAAGLAFAVLAPESYRRTAAPTADPAIAVAGRQDKR
ncbi:MAG TPA: MFS transporter [Thermomicrobiales bacterium]|nr:MFS transporter [Chloroflexota bacterium]HQZ89109.1 MFS transporter [Thermomicrobiales bacterium]HRA31836.1 MFS transporter [Thermomicrobiales bacterium]